MAEELLSVGMTSARGAVSGAAGGTLSHALRRGAHVDGEMLFHARRKPVAPSIEAPLPVEPDTGHVAPVIVLHPGVSRRWQLCKRLVDIVGAAALLMLGAPLMLVVAALLAAQGGPVLFLQQRVGLHGRLFRICKFRSMIPNAEAALDALLREHPAMREEWEHTQKLQHDPRITTLGRFLRRTSIDELPQLFNVLAGNMSLVGPRPVLEDELERYGNAARWYRAVKPGITGLWQVSGRNSTEYHRRIALDLHYVREQGLALDLSILLRTVYVVFWRIGAH